MKFRKAVIFLLCAIMSLSMLACGNIDVPDNNNNNNNDNDTTYTVIFKVGDEAAAAGVTVSAQSRDVKAGEKLGTLPTLNGEYEGHTFGGWFSGSTEYTANTVINAKVTLTAKWDAVKTHTITFKVGTQAEAAGVTVTPSTIEVADWQAIGNLPQPNPRKQNGLTFSGWYNGTTLITSSTVVTGPMTLTADWKSTAAQEEYESNIASWAKPGHLYIHYKRFNHIASEEVTPPAAGMVAGNPEYNTAIQSAEYADWGLWAWPKKNANGRLFNAAWIDASGAVFDVLLDHEYTDCGWNGTTKTSQNITNTYKDAEEIGVQIHQISTRTDPEAEFWANDGGDNYLEMTKYRRENGDYHWFINEGRVGTREGYGSAVYAEVDDFVNPYADDLNRTKNATKIQGANIITNSAADNSGTYPLKTLNKFDSVNGYQIFIASFCDSDGDGLGDIKGIISKLDYLKSLNIDLLWLTPFQTSTNYHGYDINDYYTVDSRWGTEADYRALMEAAHSKGMKIVMDFVLNHTSLSNEWFTKSQNLVKEKNVELFDKTYDEVDYRQFYSWITKAQYNKLSSTQKKHWYKDNYDYYFYSSFGSSMPELNYDYQPVRDAILDVCDYWMDFGLDGFRLDAVKHIYMCNEVQGKNSAVKYKNDFQNLNTDYDYVGDSDARFNYDIKRNLNFYREFNNRLKTKYSYAYVVGENLDGYDLRTAPFYQGIDSQFDFALYYNVPRGILRAAGVTGSFGDGLGAIYNRYNRGYEAYNRFNGGYVGGQFTSNHDLPRARDRMNTTNLNESGDKFLAFYSNNSIDGKKHVYPKEDTLHTSVTTTGTVNTDRVDFTTEMLKIYYAALMTLPGVTWLYYGDEIGMSGLMQHTLTCKDANKITSSTASDPHEDVIYRQPMKWNKATTAEFNAENGTSHGNAAFKIGYGDILCELVGINATDYVPSVAESTNNDGSFKSGTLLDWTARLTKMRKDKGITSAATVQRLSASMNECSYTVTGTKGSITVKFSTNTGLLNGTAYNGLKFTCGSMGVIITG